MVSSSALGAMPTLYSPFVSASDSARKRLESASDQDDVSALTCYAQKELRWYSPRPQCSSRRLVQSCCKSTEVSEDEALAARQWQLLIVYPARMIDFRDQTSRILSKSSRSHFLAMVNWDANPSSLYRIQPISINITRGVCTKL